VKNFLKIFVVAASFVLLFNTSSFAIVDLAVWGGWVHGGKMDYDILAASIKGEKFKGPQIGIKGHVNTSIVPFIELGVGLFSQSSDLKVDLTKPDEKIKRNTSGFDVNFILDFPGIKPYVRGTWAFHDKIDTIQTRWKTFGVGGGVELSLFFIKLYGEYMYDTSKHKLGDVSAKTFNMGVKLGF